MIFGKKTFIKGRISFLGNEVFPTIRLESLDAVSFEKYHPKLSGVTLTPKDVTTGIGKKKKKRRMARLVSTDASVDILIHNGSYNASFMGSGELYHYDRVEFSLTDDEKIIIEYTNSKNPRNHGA